MRQRKFFQHVGGTIQDLLSSLDSGSHFELARLIRLWPGIVGDTIARRTEVSALKFHTAVVRVSNAMWIQELNLMRTHILSRVNEAMRNDAVREIRFVQGRITRRPPKRLRSVPRMRRKPQLPDFADSQLREAFERLVEAWGRAAR